MRRKPHERDLAALKQLALRLWKTLRRASLHQTHDQVDGGFFHMAYRPRADAPGLGQPGDCLRRDADETALVRRQENLVVRNQPGEQSVRPGMGYEGQRKLRLARTGLTGDHNAAIAQHHRAGVEIASHVRIRQAASR